MRTAHTLHSVENKQAMTRPNLGNCGSCGCYFHNTDKLCERGWGLCRYLKSYEYRSPHASCVFEPSRWERPL